MTNDERSSLDAGVVRRLRTLIVRLRAFLFLEGVLVVLAFLLAGCWVQFTLDYAVRGLRFSMRAALLGAVIAGVGWLIWRRIMRPLSTEVGLADAARLVERRHPELSSVLISAVRFSAGQVGPRAINSPALMASVVGAVPRAVASIDFLGVLDARRARRRAIWFAAIVVTAFASATANQNMTGLWFTRCVLLRDVPWPKRTQLVVETQDGRIVSARGDDLIVQAYAQGVQPRMVELFYETVSGDRGREMMVTVGSPGAYRYRYVFKNAREDLEFYLVGGDDRTEVIKASLVDRPRVERSEIHLTPPSYSGIEPFALADGERSAKILRGTKVTLRIETNKPVVRATLQAGTSTIAEALRDEAGYRVSFSPEASHTYSFALADESGLTNRKPVSFSLRLIKDQPPGVRIKLPGVGDMVTPQAVVPIELAFSDTYGLSTVELAYRIAGNEKRHGKIDLPEFVARMPTFSTSVQWPVAAVSALPGETITLQAVATDYNDVTGPGRTESPELIIRVVTREELLTELARREQEYRQDFERLVDAQEHLRGQLLSVFGRFSQRPASDALGVDLAPLERRQRNIASSVNVVRQQFAQILAALTVNQLDTSDQRHRLETGIIEPLGRLVRRDLVTAADTMRQWARDTSPERASLVDPQQVAILAEMRQVLVRMLQWEGYHEVVNMLRDIIRLQRELNRETKDSLLEDTGDLFDN